MEWSKAKNILLWVLIFVNAFLMLNLSALVYTKMHEQTKKAKIAVYNLKDRGHSVSQDAVNSLPNSLYTYDVPREQKREEKIAENVLGKCERQSKGGGIEEYSNETGRFIFRSGGNISGELYGRNISDKLLSSSKSLFKSMGIVKCSIEERDKKVYGTFSVNNKYPLEGYDIIVEQTTRGIKISGRIFNDTDGIRTPVVPDYAKAMILIASDAEKNDKKLDIQKIEIIYMYESPSNDENKFYPLIKFTLADGVTYVNIATMEIIKK